MQNIMSWRTTRDLNMSASDGGISYRGRNIYRLIVVMIVAVSLSIPATPQAGKAPSTLRQGQSQTILPDGRLLLAGGYGSSQSPLGDLLIVDSDGNVKPLSIKMICARAGHTATVLPDGHVLIFGGYGADGKLVPFGELFDPIGNSIAAISGFRLLPRAFHTATLLTDGKLVVIGGVGKGGELVPDIQIWDYQTGGALAYEPGPSMPRQLHTATLLPNGNVQIAGGVDQLGRQVKTTEEYDPVRKFFQITGTPRSTSDATNSTGTPRLEESIPNDGATSVHITDTVAIRFGGMMAVTSLNKTNITLQDSNGNPIQVAVTAAEAGRLVFLTPSAPLQFGTNYLVMLTNVMEGKETLPTTTILFTTEAGPNDSDDEEWIPATSDFNGQWHSHTGPSDWQKIPPLHAENGVTALSGQVLRLNGRPLEHVLLEIDGQRSYTDRTGRFLVRNLHGGHHVLLIDGKAADRAGVTYGLYEVGVDLVKAKTTVLNYTVWMTKLDMADVVTIPSPTVAIDTVITSPRLPGLQLHLPPNTVIMDRQGHPVKQLTITAIPLDKPPFPLPQGVQVPIYFTIQPGGSYIDVRGYSPSGIKGAHLVYPNPYHSAPGTEFSFWNYDADSKGWYVYGHGKVDGAGTSVVPDPGVVLYELTGAMVGDAGGPYPFPPLEQDCKQCDPGSGGGDSGGGNGGEEDGAGEVDLSTGNYNYDPDDLILPDTTPISVRRSYRSNDSVSRAFGIGTTLSYDTYMSGDQHPYSFQELIQPDGSRIRFDSISPADPDNFRTITYSHTSGQDGFYGAVLPGYNSIPNNFGSPWVLRKKDGTQLYFWDSDSIPNYRLATPQASTDRYGNATTFTRDPATGNLLRVTSPSGHYIQFTYDPSNRITQATDNVGRTTSYGYDSAGRLATVKDANGGTTSYTYDSNNNLLTVTDPRGTVSISNQYDSFGRVIQQTLANGGTYLYSWTPTQNTSEIYQVSNPSGIAATDSVGFRNCSTCSVGYSPVIAQVDVTDPRGYVRRIMFDSMGRKATETFALGQPEQQAYSYSYYSDNSLQSITDPLGHRTTYTYDLNLNATEIDQLAETSNPVMTKFTYDPTFSKVTSATDPLGHTSTFTVDSNGNTVAVADPLGHGITVTYNADGTPSTTTDDQGHSVQFGYDSGAVSSIIDPLGNQTRRFVDDGGRLVSVTDPAGDRTQYGYDNLGRLTEETDPLGNKTSFSYDPNENLTRVTDVLGHITSYTYDNMNHVTTKTDPLQRVESYTYDLGGMPSTFTDRKGQVRSYTFDGIGRPSLTAFGVQSGSGGTTAQSTISFTYDVGNRLTQANDSSFGAVTRTYDSFGHVMTETSPQGSISYSYDGAGRRTTMQVAGQQQIIYTWDNANRLTGIGQGTGSVGFTYDNLNRRTTATLPNGIAAAYSYDADSHLTGIDYSQGGGVIGNLTYAYDSVGRRGIVGGSLAAINLPGPVAGASYDAANELTNWNGMAMAYDPNGSMVSDGLHAYSWDARHQLASIDSGGTATYTYDPFGRRAGRTVTGVTSTGFLSDGVNAVQEITSGSPSANITVGGIDVHFARTDASGTLTFLADALGSTVGLADGSGAISTRYTYDPFGATSQAGSPTTNASAYTGRELDVAGLYFYRARYYKPTTGRFLSEDPLGFAGSGPNLYEYAGDSPTNFVDPSGLTIGVSGDYMSFWTATQYLEGSPIAAGIMRQLENSPTLYMVNSSDNNLRGDEIAPGQPTKANWMPHGGLCSKNGMQSPALQLLHELIHMLQYQQFQNQQGPPRLDPNGLYDQWEEPDNQIVNSVARQLGEPTRDTYYYDPTGTVDSFPIPLGGGQCCKAQ
jgi:RHS repeat-associated protein